jgi:excinuclease ABC subunit C
MLTASKALKFEEAARLRDEIQMLERLDDRGELETHEQPEVFYIDPKKGLAGLRKVLKLSDTPRTIEGVDIAHLQGSETVASLVQFIDGLPFKPGYRRFKIKSVDGVDDRWRQRPAQCRPCRIRSAADPAAGDSFVGKTGRRSLLTASTGSRAT